MNGLRILHAYEPRDGGVPFFVADLAQGQAARGHEVHVLGPPATWRGRAVTTNLTVHEWQIKRRNLFALIQGRRQLVSLVLENSVDVVHLHSFVAGLIGRMARLPAAAVVFQPNAWSFDIAGVVGQAALPWEKWATRNADGIAVVCEDERRRAESHGLRSKFFNTGTAVDLDYYHPVDESVRGTLRRDLAVQQERLAVCIGRITPQKGQDQLIAAWTARSISDVELAIVGDGPSSVVTQLRKLAGDAPVRCVGEQDDVRPWLWAADVVVQPSRWEGRSIVVGEALACGVPVVATDVSGMREAIYGPNGSAGAVVPPGDMNMLIEEMFRRIVDRRLNVAERRIARSRAEVAYAPKAWLERTEDMYQALVKTPGASIPNPPRFA